MSAPGITSVKSFEYREAVEEWANTYHFVGDAPSDEAGWLSLYGSLVDIEKSFLNVRTHMVRAYCYEDTDDHSVFTLDTDAGWTPVAGTLTIDGGSSWAPGDCAMWARWKTSRTNTNGKPIYLRKYYHGVILVPTSLDADTIQTAQHDALATAADTFNDISGDWPGIAGPDGVAPGANKVSTYATTRTLKRRGARPH